MTKAHIVNHTHWDREWYFTSADSLVLSEQLFTEVIEELLAHPEATFVLDGQISILDDYMTLHPDKLEAIRQLVADKQLFIGPWYTQTDAFFTQGESILRNAMIGIFDSKKYGDYLPIGYLPDTFGFNAPIPTLLNQVGFKSLIFWRGIDLGTQVTSPYFKWRGLAENREVTAINMPHGYGTGMLLEASSAFAEGRLDPAIDFIAERSQTEEVLIPSGNDQLNIIHDFSDKIAGLNEIGQHDYQMSTYQDFIAYVETLPELEQYQGEFREPKLARVHKTIGSSRMNIKVANYHMEQKLLKRIEPLLVIAKACGINISERLLMLIWKKVLEGQAHDSLAGCVSDAVAEDIMHRMKESNEMADSIENTIVKKIADDLALTDKEVIIFNTDLTVFNGYKTITVITETKDIQFVNHRDATIIAEEFVAARDNIMQETPNGNIFIQEPGYFILKVRIAVELPALGYKVIEFANVEKELQTIVATEAKQIGNENYTLVFENKQLNLHLASGKIIEHVIQLEDIGNNGDTYDFSPLENEQALLLGFDHARVEESPTFSRLILTATYQLPLNLEQRIDTQETGEVAVELTIELATGSSIIQSALRVNNQVDSHRLRVLFQTDIANEQSIASLPFGFVTRENRDVPDWEKNYVERPVNIEPLDKSVSMSDEENVFTVLTKGIKEYEVSRHQICVTLLATTGQLGKPDLLYRPGRASGDTTKRGHVFIPTEESQLRGEHCFEFGFYVAEAAFDEQNTAELAAAYEQENIDYQHQTLNFFLHRIDNKIQKSERLLNLAQRLEIIRFSDNTLVTACHPSYYDADSWIVRVQNPTKTTFPLDTSTLDLSKVTVVNAIETRQEQNFEVPAYDSLTLKIKF